MPDRRTQRPPIRNPVPHRRLAARTLARSAARALASAALLSALATPLAAQRLPINRFTTEDGLAGSQVWDVRSDRRGLLWVASTWGFSRFDGERFTTLSVQDGLPSPNARTVLEDAAGNLWLGTGDGVARYDGVAVQAMNELPDAPRGQVWASAIDRAGRLWFGTERGLVRYADGGFRRFGRAEGLADDYVYALFVASDGALWVGSRGAGVARCATSASGELADCRRLGVAEGLGSGVVRSFAEDRSGRILIGTRGGGIAIYTNGAISSLRAADGLASDDIYALLVRRNGLIVAGGTLGLSICLTAEPGRCRVVRETNGLPTDEVRALHEDAEGALWIGTEGGLAQMIRDDFWSYSEADGLPSKYVYSVASDASGGLWLGTVDGLGHLTLGRHGDPTVRRYGRADGLPASWIWATLVDRRGVVWAGTEQGLCRMRGERCERVGAVQGVSSVYVLSLAETADSLWVGTTTGVLRLRRDAAGEIVAIESFARAQGLAGDRVYSLAVDGEGRVWAAHAEALSVFEGERFRAVQVGEGFGARSLRGLGVDRSGRVLVGAFGQLARHEGGMRFRRWTRGAGLVDEMILTLAEDERGRFVLGGHRGVVLFDPEASGGTGEVVARFNAATGTIATEVSHSAAFARDAAGNLWFGFKGGLTRLPRDPMPARLALPAVEFARLGSGRGRTFLAPYLGLGRGPSGWLGASMPEFPHDDAYLRAEVRVLSFRQRQDVRFQFLLQDEEEQWSEPRPEPFRDLMNLAPGNHRLLVRASRSDGEWGAPTTLSFRIRPAWWQTAPFRGGVAVAAGALLALALVWRTRRSRGLAAELEQRIAERTDDLARYAAALGEHLQTVDRASDRSRRAEAARRELFARTSHELRTPLTAILGFSELLERALGERLEERERKYLANVRDSGELLLRQINNLLDQLKLEAGRMELHLEELSIAALVESVASLMEGYALHRGVRLAVDTGAELPPVRADLAKLRQVLMNLISNAIKFSPAGETVSITVSAQPSEESSWPGGGYQVTIRDRGPGIPAEALDAIFEPYRQLEGAGATSAGTGLGLPISRQFVDLLGGRIEVRSTPGQGAEFRIVLPVEPAPGAVIVDGADSGGFEPTRPQLLLMDRDRERFLRLSRAAGGAELLAVRVDDSAALRRMFGTLRPRAAALVVDPLHAAGWSETESAIRVLGEQATPFLLLVCVEGRAVALAFGGVLGAEAEESRVRRVLRALGVGARAGARRPLALIAASRETGIRFGGALGAAGCDHFRVEGDGARQALADVTPDLVAADWSHALALATELALPDAPSGRALVLIDAGSASAGDLARVAERCADADETPERALLAGMARLLGATPRAGVGQGSGGAT